MKKIKMMLALLAALVCGGAWATPTAIVEWAGDFASMPTKISSSGKTYTLIPRGNKVENGEITIDQNLGVQIRGDLGTSGGSVLVKYRNLKTQSSTKTLACAMDANFNRPGIRMTGNDVRTVTGYYETNSGVYGMNDCAPVEEGYLLFSYDPNTNGAGIYTGTTIGSLSGGSNSGLKWPNSSNNVTRRVTCLSVGGPILTTTYGAWTDMVIEKVAVFSETYSGTAAITAFADFDWAAQQQVNKPKFHQVIALNLNANAVDNTADAGIPYLPIIGSQWKQPGNIKTQSDAYTLAVYNTLNGQDVTPSTAPTATWNCNNTYTSQCSAKKCNGCPSVVFGYLDDGGSNNKVTISNIPFDTYDVIVLYGSDQDNGNYLNGPLKLTINDDTATAKTYTYAGDTVAEGTNGWGGHHNTVVDFGMNAIRVPNLSGSKIEVNPQLQNGRAGLAAVVIVGPEATEENSNAILVDATTGNVEHEFHGISSEKGTIHLIGSNKVTLKNIASSDLAKINTTGFTGTIELYYDCTEVTLTADDALKSFIRNVGNAYSFVFKGNGVNGATLDWGSTQEESGSVIFSTHIVFDGGTHTLKYVKENSGSKFGVNATQENPTIRVTNEATLNFTGKNWCGWESGAVNANGIIRVDSGATLNASTDSIGTFYWAQQFYLEPGSTANFRSNNNNVRFNGGINENAPQIFVPGCAESAAKKIATVSLVNNKNLEIRDQGEKGAAFFVGENATLKISGNLTGPKDLTKYGAGILEIDGDISNTGTLTIAAGFLKQKNAPMSGNLKIEEGASIVFPEETAEDTAYTLCNGALTPSAATVEKATIYVGEQKLSNVTLTYNSTAKTASYAIPSNLQTWTYNKASGSWNDVDAWIDEGNNVHSWSEANAKTIAVFDADKTSSITVNGKYAPNMVRVIGSGNFIFHNHTGNVNNSDELNAAVDCISAPVVMTDFSGNLGLRVAITGAISFGSGVHLVFSSGNVGDTTTAYGYDISGRTQPIGVSGSGTFIVPSSMYNLPFEPAETAAIEFKVAEGTATASPILTGSGTVIKNGAGALDLTADIPNTLTLTVSEGTLNYTPANQNGFKGTLNVKHGATYVNKRGEDVWGYNYSGVVLNIHGTFDMGTTRANVNSGQTWNIYGGATITCEDTNTRCFDFADQSNPTLNFKKHVYGNSDVVNFDVQGSYRTKDPTFNIEEGVTVVVSKTQDRWESDRMLTKTGLGTLKFASTGKINNASIALNVQKGHLDLTALETTAADNIKGNLTIADGVILHLPASLVENTAYTLCGGTLTATSKTMFAYIGEAVKLVALSYDTENKTVSYATPASTAINSSAMIAAGVTSMSVPAGSTVIVDELPSSPITIQSEGAIKITADTWQLTAEQKDAIKEKFSITGGGSLSYAFDASFDVSSSYFGKEAAEWTNVYGGPLASEATDASVFAQWAKVKDSSTLAPQLANSDNWDPMLFDGALIQNVATENGYKTVNVETAWVGWGLKVGAVNNTKLVIKNLNSFQSQSESNGGTMLIGVDATSKILVEKYNSGNNSYNAIIDIAAPKGLEIDSDVSPTTTNAGTFKYRFRGTGESAGSILIYGAYNVGASHEVEYIELSKAEIGSGQYTVVKERKLIGFASTNREDSKFKFADGAQIVLIGYSEWEEKPMPKAKLVGQDLSAKDEVAEAQIVKKSDGIYLQWVGLSDKLPSQYEWLFTKTTGNWSDIGAWEGLYNKRALTWGEKYEKDEAGPEEAKNFVTENGATYLKINKANDFYFYFDAANSQSVVVDTAIAESTTGTNVNTGDTGTGHRYIKVVGSGTFKFNLPQGTGVDSEGAPEDDFDWNNAVALDVPVDASSFSGELGLRAKITQPVTLGSEAKIVFVKPDANKTTIAYNYQIRNRGGSIEARGPGDFKVPTNMYDVPFKVTGSTPDSNEAGHIIYDVATTAEVTGDVSGKGGVIKDGEGSLILSGVLSCDGGITVKKGTLRIPARKDDEKYPLNITVLEDASVQVVVTDDMIETGYNADNINVSGGAITFVDSGFNTVANSGGSATVLAGTEKKWVRGNINASYISDTPLAILYDVSIDYLKTHVVKGELSGGGISGAPAEATVVIAETSTTKTINGQEITGYIAQVQSVNSNLLKIHEIFIWEASDKDSTRAAQVGEFKTIWVVNSKMCWKSDTSNQGTIVTDGLTTVTDMTYPYNTTMIWVKQNIVATIGGNGYYTLAAAFSAAGAEDTIVLCADVAGNLSVPAGKKVNAGNYSVGDYIEIEEGAELTISGNRTTHGIYGNGKLIHTSGTLKAMNKASGYAIEGVTIQIDGTAQVTLETGSKGCFEDKPNDSTINSTKFVIGANATLTNYGWVNIVGSIEFNTVGDKAVFDSEKSFRGAPSVTKSGEGLLTFNLSRGNEEAKHKFVSLDVAGGEMKFAASVVVDTTTAIAKSVHNGKQVFGATLANTITAADAGSTIELLAACAEESVAIPANKTVKTTNTAQFSGTVTGAGRIVFEGYLPADSSETARSFVDSESWTGVVEMKDYKRTDNANIIYFSKYANLNSTVALNGVEATMFGDNSHGHQDQTLGTLEIGEGGWTSTADPYSNSPTYYTNLKGTGEIKVVQQGSGVINFIGDHSAFRGRIAIAETSNREVFLQNAGATKRTNNAVERAITIGSDCEMTLAKGAQWTAPAGVRVNGKLLGEGDIRGAIRLDTNTAKATVLAVTGIVTSGVPGYDVICNEFGSVKSYELIERGAEPPKVLIPAEIENVALVPGQAATYQGDTAPTVTVKIANEEGGAAYDVTSYCTVTTANGTITTTLDAEKVRPAEANITMSTPTEGEGESATDKVQFTITNPIPGLFYEIVSGDSFDAQGDLVIDYEAEKGTSQATTAADKTVSIPMEFSAGKKVKYYKVSVKATK